MQQEENLNFDIEKQYQGENNNEIAAQQKPSYFKKIKEKINSVKTPDIAKIETIFESVKDAQTIFTIERNTYKFVMNLNKLLIAIIIILIILIISLFPLKEKEPYLVGFSNATQNFVHIERANETIQANEALVRNLIGSYIINRETINQFDDQERYETIRMQSNFRTWQIFQNIVAQEESIYGNSNITREVKIVNIAKFKKGYANAEIGVTLRQAGKIQAQKRYRVTLTYKFNDLEIDYESLPKNPTGFEVQDYAITEIAVIKELDEVNRVDFKGSKSKIKQSDGSDSNEFLREAYDFKEYKENERKNQSQAEEKDFFAEQRSLAEEINQMKKEQEQQENKKDNPESQDSESSAKSPFAN